MISGRKHYCLAYLGNFLRLRVDLSNTLMTAPPPGLVSNFVRISLLSHDAAADGDLIGDEVLCAGKDIWTWHG